MADSRTHRTPRLRAPYSERAQMQVIAQLFLEVVIYKREKDVIPQPRRGNYIQIWVVRRTQLHRRWGEVMWSNSRVRVGKCPW